MSATKKNKKFKLTKKDLIVFLYIGGFVLIQTIVFSIGKLFAKNATVVSTSFDKKIPFIPFFIFFYCSWYVLILLVPYLVYRHDRDTLIKHFSISLIGSTITLIIFIVFPTCIVRDSVEVTSISTYIIDKMYMVDNPTCCLPSLHCVQCFYLIISVLNVNMRKSSKAVVIILSLLIVLSTLFVKQHAILDVAAAFVITLACYVIVYKFKFNPAKKITKYLP